MLQMTLQKEEYIISETADREPEVDNYLYAICYNTALRNEQQARVRNDVFFFAGKQILEDSWKMDGVGMEPATEQWITQQVRVPDTSYRQTYLSGISLDETMPNGFYETNAEIVYRGDEQNIGTEKEKKVILEVNDITIHTPVICHGEFGDGVRKEDGALCLVLKDALNFFMLSVSNSGIHRRSLGYGEKNFAYSLSEKCNLAIKDGKYLNQICFPFDVYVDERNDSLYPDGSWHTDGDYLLQAGTWITTGVEQQRFYLPVTTKNGEYEVKFRSIAINCPKKNGEYQMTGKTEEHANLSENHYIATDVVNLTIKSYVKDFRITATDDYNAAKLLEEDCQALTLKKGYGFSYTLFSRGEFFGENVEINITPNYFWESEDGMERQKVRLYRGEEVLSGNYRECYAWDSEPLLLQHENYDVIQQQFEGRGMISEDVLCVLEKDSAFYEEYLKIQTFTGKEEFIKKSGYLIIQFEIKLKSNENRWYTFDKWMETELAMDAVKEGWNYIAGDVIRYDLSKSIREDYEVGGVE